MRKKGNLDNKVSFWIEKEFDSYPSKAPFHPNFLYPEYEGEVSEEGNLVYDAVRNNFRLLGFDIENYGKRKWNPLKEIIKNGDAVLLKPNFVLHENSGGGSVWSVITHPSVIRAVIDYVYLALEGNGRIIIADAPQANGNFEKILEITCLRDIVAYYKQKYDFEIEIYDLRQLRFEYQEGILLENSRIEMPGDPLGYTIFDLKDKSNFVDISNPEKIYGADYDRIETLKHHSKGHHKYCIANTVLNADVIISIPKMKTHRKAGVTLNLKNFIGINGNKNYLPHFRIGDAKDGGDEYAELNNIVKLVKYSNRFLIDKLLVDPNTTKTFLYEAILKLYRICKALKQKENTDKISVSGGGWYGNDTLWRTILDLNQIVEYGSLHGEILFEKQRRFFSVIDGMIAGEGNGPISPKDKKCKLILMGENLLYVDLVAMRLMGVDYKNVKAYNKLLVDSGRDIEDIFKNIDIYSNYHKKIQWDGDSEKYFEFMEADGWEGHLLL
ncbi:MAG: DUF362 domain-containing protein [Lachnospiraceae bacterium]|nr:DUF362 domain-containing protein [Lachnospiraceae bacterium]